MKPVSQIQDPIIKSMNNAVAEGKCPLCTRDINMNNFKDQLSLEEYYISGLCQKCQNTIWGQYA